MLTGFFLTSIPPNLMLYVGRVLTETVPANLCLAQMAMMDTVPTLVFLVVAILALDNLVELCHLCLRSRHFTRQATVYSILLVFPYFLIAMLTIWSYMTVISDDKFAFERTQRLHWVWCRTDNPGSHFMVQPAMKILALITAVVNFCLEVGVVVMIYVFPIKEERDVTAWRTTSSFALRSTFVFFVQLVTIILSAAQAAPSKRPDGTDNINFPYKIAFEMIISLNGILVFLIIGTQKVILRKWASWAVLIWHKICRTPEEQEGPDSPQPFGLPSWQQFSPGTSYPRQISQWSDDGSIISTDMKKEGKIRNFSKAPSFLALPLWKKKESARR